MSVQNAAAFIQKVSEDESIYLAVKKLQPKDFDGLLKVASTAGLPFSLDEWKEAVESGNTKGELNDKQLDNVSGGVLTTFTLSPALSSFTGGLNFKCYSKCKFLGCQFNTF